jgi:hypothetical protein
VYVQMRKDEKYPGEFFCQHCAGDELRHRGLQDPRARPPTR